MKTEKKKPIIGVIKPDTKFQRILADNDMDNISLAIKGMDDYDYFQMVFIKDQRENINRERIRNEMVEAVIDLKNSCNELGSRVLERTNMSRYAYDIQKCVNLPVFDMYSLIQWIYSGLVKEIFKNKE